MIEICISQKYSQHKSMNQRAQSSRRYKGQSTTTELAFLEHIKHKRILYIKAIKTTSQNNKIF